MLKAVSPALPALAPLYDVVIVGAGPAGLATAAALAGSSLRWLLIEAGKEIGARDRQAPTDIAAGVGGAGLFSDGKFSFYPSASGLWALRWDAPASLAPSAPLLDRAFAETAALLAEHGLPAPDLPSPLAGAVAATPGGWSLKPYPAVYMPLSRRLALTRQLFAAAAAPEHHLLGTQVVSMSPVGVPPEGGAGRDELAPIELLLRGAGRSSVRARHVVLGGGRFQPMLLGTAGLGLGLPSSFQRLEYGVRVQDRADGGFFAGLAQAGVDPKLRLLRDDGQIEWRTFCCCRQGEVAATRVGDILTVSGRADCPPTGVSSIGLHVRVLDPDLSRRLRPSVMQGAKGAAPILLRLRAALHGDDGALRRCFGDEGAGTLVEGLRRLCAAHPTLPEADAVLLGPTLEGVGDYPITNAELRVPGTNRWVVGDACGRFRGIVASLVSGRYVGAQLRRLLAG